MNNNQLDSRPVIVSVAATGTAAILLFAVMPVIVGALAGQFGLSDTQAGFVATAYFLSYALVALTSPLWVRRLNWRFTARGAFSVLFVGIAVTSFAGTYEQALIGMVISGLGAGVLFPISLTLAADTANPDRTYGIKLTAEQLVPAALLLLIPLLSLGAGVTAIMFPLLITVGLCLLASLGLPAAGRFAQEAVSGSHQRAGLGYLGLVALAINFAGFGGLWVFFARIAVAEGFSADFTNLWLAVGLITSGVGPLLAALLADRFGRIVPISLGTVAAVLSISVLGLGVNTFRYALVLFCLPLAYYFAVSYVMSVIASADTNGRIAGLMSFALAVGAASGPAIYGTLNDSGAPVLLVMSLLIAVGAVLVIIVARGTTGTATEVVR